MRQKLTTFAADQQRRFDALTSRANRKECGHFGTPEAIAEFMAEMFSELPRGTVRILDPGAGVGMLTAALCDRFLDEAKHRAIEVEAWENNSQLEKPLRATLDRCKHLLESHGHEMRFVVHKDDFILANSGATLFDAGPEPRFHLAILNPPYFKLRKDSTQAHAMQHVVHGQPNIYALFMAVAADLLLPNGELVAITPRSYFNGAYFRKFRKWFFDRMAARQIHTFESRKDAFRQDEVLQENVILMAEKEGKCKDVQLTSTVRREFSNVTRCNSPYNSVLMDGRSDHVVRVATNPVEHEIIRTIDRLPCRLREMEFHLAP